MPGASRAAARWQVAALPRSTGTRCCRALVTYARIAASDAAGAHAREELRLALGHHVAKLVELLVVEDLTGLREHVVLFLLDVVLDVLDHDPRLRAPGLVVDRQPIELGEQGVDDVVLLVALEHD